MKFYQSIACALALVLIASFVALVPISDLLPDLSSNRDPLPILNQVTPFNFHAHDNKQHSIDSYMGKVWTANLFFTSCAGICPMITANLRSATAAFESNLSFAQLSLSVDPETDSVDKLAEYADRFDLDQQNWLLARVNREQLKDIALKKLRIGYDQSEPSLHSPHTVLIDQRLRIRGYYDATDLDAMKKLTKDIKILLQDNHPSHD